MICVNNDSRCIQVGYCSCHRDDLSEAATGAGGLMFGAVIGIFISFLYPAIKILRSARRYEASGAPKFSGGSWLFVSPAFGLLSNMLYQVTFALAACSAGAIQLKFTNSIYLCGMFAIYGLATGLAVLVFGFKNRKVIRSMLITAENRTFNKMLTLICAGLMGLLAAFFAAGAGVAAATTYFEFKTNIQKANDNEESLISKEKDKFDSYAGKYKLTTQNDKTLFLVSKSKTGKALRLNMHGESNNSTGNSGCLLTPGIEGNSIYYAVSDCFVENKPSPLVRVYFRIEKNKVKMDFVYNVRANADTLEKIK